MLQLSDLSSWNDKKQSVNDSGHSDVKPTCVTTELKWALAKRGIAPASLTVWYVTKYVLLLCLP